MIHATVLDEKGHGAFRKAEAEYISADAVMVFTSDGFMVCEKAYFSDSIVIQTDADRTNFFVNALMLLGQVLADMVGVDALIRIQNESILREKERLGNAENI